MYARRILYILFPIVIVSLSTLNYADADKPCVPRRYNHSSIVCVCNAYYCDNISEIKPKPKGHYAIYTTTKSGLRFEKFEGKIGEKPTRKSPMSFADMFELVTARRGVDATLKVTRNKQYQKLKGFGASFSDTAGILYNKLSKSTRRHFMNSYFSKNGLEYNMGRVPIGGSDFSSRPYTYNMKPENDLKLSNFSLSNEDFIYKIPMIKEAMRLATDDILLMASTWSPPVWMKTNKKIGGNSRLLKKYYQTFADYHIRFLEEYEKNGITFWAISTGNEPSNGMVDNFPPAGFNSLGWNPDEQVKWIAKHFGPTLKASRYAYLKVLGIDDQRYCLPMCTMMLARDKEAFKYIDGISIHWYWDIFFHPNLVNVQHNMFPHLFIINAESSLGILPWVTEKVQLGEFSGAELYARIIIEDLNHWYEGWIDWNLAVDKVGGPNWYGNHVDSTIIIMPEQDEFLKQPTYYAFGHFSKFLPRGSIRVHVDILKGDIDNVAFLRPDGGLVVIMVNPTYADKTVTIQEDGMGSIKFDVKSHSIHTVVYW